MCLIALWAARKICVRVTASSSRLRPPPFTKARTAAMTDARICNERGDVSVCVGACHRREPHFIRLPVFARASWMKVNGEWDGRWQFVAERDSWEMDL